MTQKSFVPDVTLFESFKHISEKGINPTKKFIKI